MQRYIAKRLRLAAVLVATGITFWCAQTALATPDVPLDDLTYLRLYRLQDLGLIPVWPLSGIRPLTEAHIQSLLLQAGLPPDDFLLSPEVKGFWLKPVDRLGSRLALSSDTLRNYSAPARPRDIDGAVELACEHQEGRPCGNGANGMLELDSSAGFGTWFSALSRMQARTGSSDSGGSGVNIDRLYVNLELGPAEFFAGRNVVSVGPGRRTQLIWGDQPPPLDHVGLTIHALKVPKVPIVLGGAYLVGMLDAPQRFPHSLVTISRGYLEVDNRLCLGVTNLLLLGGDGAPPFTFGQFIEEHLYRTGPQQSGGISDRRVAADLTLNIQPLQSTFYTEVAFEDSRRQFMSTLAYDTDYLVGWASALGRDGRHGLLIEFLHTGVRSQEHGMFTSGMTSGGRTAGPPLGPDATSLYVSPRFDLKNGKVSVSPWSELIHIGSDVYVFPDNGPIYRSSSGLAEIRLRAGLRVIDALRSGLWLQADSFIEHVGNEAFRVATRNNAGVSLAVIWKGPGGLVGGAGQ